MSVSGSLSNFAKVSCIAFLLASMASCKGRTIENMEPTGDTVEVVIVQDSNEELNQQTNLE